MELIWLELVWQTGKLLQQCGKHRSGWAALLWRWDKRNAFESSFTCFILCCSWNFNFFTNHSWLAVDYFWDIFLRCLQHSAAALTCSQVSSRSRFPIEMCPVSWFSGSLGVNTAGMCTVLTSTESITTAWTLSVTTRWAWVLYHFFNLTQIYIKHFLLCAANCSLKEKKIVCFLLLRFSLNASVAIFIHMFARRG